MATKAASSSLSPCLRLMEESLLLPTQNAGLFASTFLLIFAHTFTFIAVAVHFAHPLATSLLADIEALKTTTTTTSHDEYSTLVHTTSEHATKLFLVYLAYLASKLATQLAAALAASTTHSRERLTRKVVRDRLTGGGLLGTAALAGALELSLTALLAALLVSTWALAGSSVTASACGYLLLLAALLFSVYLGTVVTVSVAASAVDRNCHGVGALRRAWRLMGTRRKEAAVLVLVVTLLPAVIYPAPVFAFSFVYPAERYSPWYYEGDRVSTVGSQEVWLFGVVSGSGLPSVGAQLLSVVAATVFCCLSSSMETSNATTTRDAAPRTPSLTV